MKTTHLLLAAVLIIASSTSVFGQTQSMKKNSFFKGQASASKTIGGNYYTFAKTTGTYTDLTGATPINNGQVWDDPEYVIPVGFPFMLYNLMLDSLHFEAGLGTGMSNAFDANGEADYIIAPFEADLIDRGDITSISTSPISYKVEGSVGSRILKIEWKNAGFYMESDSLGSTNDYINIQAWLYEGSNDIEFHYGPSSIADANLVYEGESGAIIGMADWNEVDMYLLKGPAANPIMQNAIDYISGTPTDGTIYRFMGKPSNINNSTQQLINAQIFPNPMKQSALLKIDNYQPQNAHLIITDVQGRIVREIENIRNAEVIINRGNLNTGIYFYQLVDEGKNLSRGKFIIE